MNKMKLPSLMLCLFTTLFIISCDKTEDSCSSLNCLNNSTFNNGMCECLNGFEGEFCEIKIKLLKYVNIDDKLIESYIYDSENRLISSTTYSSSGPAFISNYRYTEDSIVVDTDNIILGSQFSTEYIKLDDDQVKSQLIASDFLEMSYNIRSLFDDDCGFSQIETFSFQDEIIKTVAIEFTDSNCSQVIATNSEEIIQLNDGFNYYGKSISIPFLKSQNRGNTIKYSTSNSSISYESVFMYDTENYPISEIRTYQDGDIESITYEYY